MGETTSSWKLPLHSSDSEHPEQTRRNFKGDGQPLKLKGGERTFPCRADDVPASEVNASTARTNPFYHKGS